MITVQSIFQPLRNLWGSRQLPPEPSYSYYLHTAQIDNRSLVTKEGYEVCIPRTNQVVLSLRPARGELRRNPQVFEAWVIDSETLASEIVMLRYGQPLTVKVLM